MKRYAGLRAILLCSVLFAIGGCGSKKSVMPNLLLVTLDTTRADHLGCYGYFRNTSPTIDALADQAVLLEKCYAPIATTLPSHTSLLTGVYPLEHGITANLAGGGIPVLPSANLHSYTMVLRETGYRTAAFVSALPLRTETGISRGFEVFEEPVTKRRSAKETNKGALEWLASMDERPFFLWVHYFDPHGRRNLEVPADTVFFADESMEAFLEPRAVPLKLFATTTGDSVNTRELIDWYDGQIRTMDGQVGVLFDAIRSMGLWESTVVLVVGDHGEGLGQHRVLHHERIWGEQLHVPVILRVPGQEPRRIGETVSLIDVLPTLLALEPSLPRGAFLEQARGRDVLNGSDPLPVFGQESDRTVARERDHSTYSLTTDEWRYIYRTLGNEMLYDLKEDPFEIVNLAPEREELTKRFRAELESLIRDQMEKARFYRSGEDSSQTIELSPEDEASMRALGYVD